MREEAIASERSTSRASGSVSLRCAPRSFSAATARSAAAAAAAASAVSLMSAPAMGSGT